MRFCFKQFQTLKVLEYIYVSIPPIPKGFHSRQLTKMHDVGNKVDFIITRMEQVTTLLKADNTHTLFLPNAKNEKSKCILYYHIGCTFQKNILFAHAYKVRDGLILYRFLVF